VTAAKVRLGGMALANGVLVHGPTSWGCAVRTPDGELRVASAKKVFATSTMRNPVLRGPAKLVEALAVLPQVKRALPEARLPFERPAVLGAMVASTASIRVLRRSSGLNAAARELAGGVLSFAPAVLALRGGDLASYHGAEHKTIAAYEQDEDAAAAGKEHDRCGSNLVAPMLASAAAGNAAARRAGLRGPMAEAAVGLGSVAFAVEVFAWSERHAESTLARMLRLPGHEIQRVFGTREPTRDQLDVAHAALEEILRVEGG
jgi:uncharacterized protein YqhQ